MKIVIPMAGRGSRLSGWRQNLPKPLLPVFGKPMIQWALESVKELMASQTIVIALREHEEQFGLTDILKPFAPAPIEVYLIDRITEGQLCTVLAARDLIDNDEDILIASADTFVKSNLGSDIIRQSGDCQGIISVANLDGNQWSFARVDATGIVVEVKEKVRISQYASTGLYYFRSGDQFVAIGEEMIRNEEKTKGEYYIIPIYQKYIERGMRIKISVADEVWDMGTPEAIKIFEDHLAKQL